MWLSIRDIEDKAVRRRAKERGKPEPEPRADGKLHATTVQGWKRALNQLATAYPTAYPPTRNQQIARLFTRLTDKPRLSTRTIWIETGTATCANTTPPTQCRDHSW